MRFFRHAHSAVERQTVTIKADVYGTTTETILSNIANGILPGMATVITIVTHKTETFSLHPPKHYDEEQRRNTAIEVR